MTQSVDGCWLHSFDIHSDLALFKHLSTWFVAVLPILSLSHASQLPCWEHIPRSLCGTELTACIKMSWTLCNNRHVYLLTCKPPPLLCGFTVQSRRAVLTTFISTASILPFAESSMAAYGDGANIFGRTTNQTGYMPYVGKVSSNPRRY